MHAESPCKSVSFFVTKVWYKYSIPDFLQKSKPIFLVRDIKTANAALAQSNPQRSAHRCRPCHNRIPTRLSVYRYTPDILPAQPHRQANSCFRYRSAARKSASRLHSKQRFPITAFPQPPIRQRFPRRNSLCTGQSR